MCKWCARQCRPVRHHSSVRAQLRPRSPHVRRQNPDPRHRNARGTCAGHVCEVASGGGRGAHASDSAKRACVSGRWAQGVHWARALVALALFSARGEDEGAFAWRITREEVRAKALRTNPSALRRLSAVTLFVNLPMAPGSAEQSSAAEGAACERLSVQ